MAVRPSSRAIRWSPIVYDAVTNPAGFTDEVEIKAFFIALAVLHSYQLKETAEVRV